MKLSEAIRLGAMLKPQGFGSMRSCEAVASPSDTLSIRVIEKTCALGAAFDAGYRADATYGIPVACPLCSFSVADKQNWADLRVGGVVMHLNDFHRWTREQIADWVESIEPAEDAKQQSEPAAIEVAK